MSDKNFVRLLFKYLTTASLAVVALIGLGVIIGWHFHSLALVQVIPGAIPMQYNTALCFIALALSAGALISKRLPTFLAVLGDGFVGLMGAAVIFEYAARISLGIDTFFFYPWNQTLSADPGRMALTSAISFAVAGFSGGLLAFKRQTLVVFAVAHALPLSLGLTSLFGYLFGITYVLPFRLGSQMAVHTAFAFTIYSISMLFYVWRQIPQTEEGLPRWSPGIVIVIVPVFFIGFTSVGQDNSLVSVVGQMLLALAVAALLALAIRQLNQTRIVYKGLILISIPLLFVLGFVWLVNQQRQAGEQAQTLALHSQEVIARTHNLSESLVDAQASVRGFVITGEASYLEPYQTAARRIPEEVKQLQTLVSDNPQQSERAENLSRKALERLNALEETKTLLNAGRRDDAIALIKSGSGKQLMDEFRGLENEFLAEEQRLDETRRQEVQNSWQRFDWLLVAGTSADLLLAFMLAFLFTSGIGRRLRTLTENARALADGNSLARPLAGTDEIAKLDKTFHQMAQALQKSRDELESKVEERTSELLQATEEIQKLNESLENRVVERTAQLEAANKELEAFSYSVSHDLCAPLRAIDGFSRIFQEDYAEKLDDEGRRVLNVIRSNAQNMGQLIDDLLAFSRLGRKEIEPTKIDMSELARDVFGGLESNSDSRTNNLEVECLPEATGDRSLLRQVFVNLLSNAVKYSETKENAPIKVGGRNENGENIYYVQDNGVGFDMKYADKLFGVFQRLHSAEEFEGTGVGLAIVQRIINRHGGRVWAKAEVGKGATFYFALPRNGFHQVEENNGHQ